MKLKPFIGYIGSKKNFMKELNFPEEINNYYEPFIGGGSVFFHINNNYEINKNYINDLNKNVINIYNEIKKNPEKMINNLEKLNKKKSKEDFYLFVNKYNSDNLDNLEKSSLYIYLNKVSFNNNFNYNKIKNKIKPYYSLSHSKSNIYKESNIKNISKLLKKTIISNIDYKNFIKKYKPKKGDFVFLDPPYLVQNVKQYYKNIFKLNDFKEMKDLCDKLNDKEVNFMITLNKNDELIKIFNNYNIKFIEKKSFISTFKKVENEIIITNY